VTDGSQYARACYTGPYTANHIHEALRAEVRRRNLPILENVMATDLALDSGGRAAGVRLADGRIVRAGAVVLATGGAGQAYEVNVFPEGMTGDGHALAYRAGAELVNLEFIQFGLSSVKTQLACSGSLMRAWPRLVTDAGREFLADYFPDGTPPEQIYSVLFRKGASWPVSYEEPSHVIDVAVFSEMQKGHTVFRSRRWPTRRSRGSRPSTGRASSGWRSAASTWPRATASRSPPRASTSRAASRSTPMPPRPSRACLPAARWRAASTGRTGPAATP